MTYLCPECSKPAGDRHADGCLLSVHGQLKFVTQGEEIIEMSFAELTALLGIEFLEVVGAREQPNKLDAFYVAGMKSEPTVQLRILHPLAHRNPAGGQLAVDSLGNFRERMANLLTLARSKKAEVPT